MADASSTALDRPGVDCGALSNVPAACYWAGVRGVVYGTSITDLIRFGWHQIDLPMPALLACARPPRR